jgi:hypothetical protein
LTTVRSRVALVTSIRARGDEAIGAKRDSGSSGFATGAGVDEAKTSDGTAKVTAAIRCLAVRFRIGLVIGSAPPSGKTNSASQI